MGELLGLSWDNYKESITGHLKSLIQDEEFVDVSLHCEGKTLKAHKVYLSACSEYFKIVLKGTNLWQHPILFLNEIPFSDLQKILEFVYCGEVQLQQKRLTSFLKSAEILKIKGLNNDVNNHVTSNIDQSVDEHNFVRRKKRRKASDENSRTIDDNFGSNQVNNKDFETVKNEVNNDDISECEQVVVKADPEDFQTNEEEHNFVNNFNVTQNDESSANRGIVIRNDLMNPEANLSQGPMYGERGRCHFCQLLCPDRQALTQHLKTSHQPPKHSLCENCENFFHICAITRHREKCKARYQTDK